MSFLFRTQCISYTVAMILTTTVAVHGDDDRSDRTAALRELQFHRTAAALVRLLSLNKDTTSHIEKLGHPTNSAGITDIATIHSAGVSYIAVVARRYPPEQKYPFGEDGIGVCFLFDRDGTLKARFGGELGPDGVNGDEVQFTTLGTSDRWFVRVRRFQKKDEYSKRSDVFLVDADFPLAFRVWSNKSIAWTEQPYSTDRFEFSHFFNPGELDLGVKGQAADGRSYHLIIGWDANEQEFRGPSRITHDDSNVFVVDLDSSKRFTPIDRDDTKQPADTPIIDERLKDERPGRRRAERSKESGNSLAVNDIENEDAIASFSSIHNVDGWSREELVQTGISIAAWKHELQTEHPPRNWIEVSFDRAHVPRSQDCLMTVHFVSDEGVLEGASRAVWDENENDVLRLRFTVSDRYRGRSNGSNVEIVMWTERPDGGGKHAVGYRLSLNRIIEPAGAIDLPNDN